MKSDCDCSSASTVVTLGPDRHGRYEPFGEEIYELRESPGGGGSTMTVGVMTHLHRANADGSRKNRMKKSMNVLVDALELLSGKRPP